MKTLFANHLHHKITVDYENLINHPDITESELRETKKLKTM
jgi:hypothetical protein